MRSTAPKKAYSHRNDQKSYSNQKENDNITIQYVKTDTADICASAKIDTSLCMDGVCNHTFIIPSSSDCPHDTNITVTVSAESNTGNKAEKREIGLSSSCYLALLF